MSVAVPTEKPDAITTADDQEAAANGASTAQKVQSSREKNLEDNITPESNTAVARLSLGNQRQRRNPNRTGNPALKVEEGLGSMPDVDQNQRQQIAKVWF